MNSTHKVPELQPEDTFKFTCKRCGKCCTFDGARMELTPYDVYSMANATGMPLEKFISRFCSELSVNPALCGPVFYSIDVNTGTNKCKLYSKKNGCAVHGNAPFHCRVYPLTVFSHKDLLPHWQYGLNNAYGNHRGEIHTVKEWVGQEYSRQELDIKQNWDISMALLVLRDAEQNKASGKMEMSKYKRIRDTLYTGYTEQRPFIEQMNNKLMLASRMISE